MYRTTHKRFWRHLGEFLWKNSRLLVFLALFLIGVLTGCSVYTGLSPAQQAALSGVLSITTVTKTVGGVFSALFSSANLLLILLAVLLLAGLSVCGAPIVGIVPILYGMGIGMIEVHYYSGGNSLLTMLVLIIPSTLAAAWTLLMACAESLRMTLRLAGQMLPNASQVGGLWSDGKLYFFRFLIFTALAFLSALINVIMRLVFC